MSDSRPGNLVWAKDTSWILSANVLRNVGLIVILVLLARLTSPDVVGRYALALALTTPIFTFAQFGLKGVYLTMRADYRFRSYVVVQVTMLVLALIVSVAVALIFTPDVTLTVALVAAIKGADAMSDLFSGPMQKYRSAPRIFLGYLLGALAASAVTGAALALTGSLDVALAGLMLTSVLTAAVLMGRPARQLTMRHEDSGHSRLRPREDRRAILRAGFPMGLATAILALVSSMPQFFLAHTHGEAAVGFFAVLLYVLAIVDIFSGTLTQTWIPKARRALQDHEAAPRRFLSAVAGTAAWWTLAFVLAAILGLWIAGFLLPLVFGAHYQIGLSEMLPLGVSVALLPAVHFSSTAIVVRNFWTHGVVLGIVAATVSLAACAALIPAFGAVGALWATAAALAARALAGFSILYRRSRPSRDARDGTEPGTSDVEAAPSP